MDKLAELDRIAKLYEQGYLTETEFSAQKARILGAVPNAQNTTTSSVDTPLTKKHPETNILLGFQKNKMLVGLVSAIVVCLGIVLGYFWYDDQYQISEAQRAQMHRDSIARATATQDSLKKVVEQAKAEGKAEGAAEAFSIAKIEGAHRDTQYDLPLYCTGENVNVRSTPNLSGDIIDRLTFQEKVGSLSRTKLDDRGAVWCNITKDGTEGWVSEKMLSSNASFKSEWKRYNIKENYAALYQNNESAHTVGKVTKQDRFTVCERSGQYNRFLIIMPDETRGYLYGKDIAW